MIIENYFEGYFSFCHYQKRLNEKTLKAYRIDLKQVKTYFYDKELNKENINKYIVFLKSKYKTKTIKRKITTLKSFVNYLEYEEIIENNPFKNINIKFKEEFILPKIIPLLEIEKIINYIYNEYKIKDNNISKLRDLLLVQLLISTGMRVSEISNLKLYDININNNTFKINGKGDKERIIYINNEKLKNTLIKYIEKHSGNEYLFVNNRGSRLSEQSIRFMLKKYAKLSGVQLKITPHMFRHTFATMLLDEDVDIRHIQQILGHSSIITTQIYTHMSISKQKEILNFKNPINKIRLY